jgi:hypothetical protein
MVRYLRRKSRASATFVFPSVEDLDEIPESSIETILEQPVLGRRGEYYFEQLEGMDEL